MSLHLIRPARFPQDRDAVLAIFREYVASPSVSLDFQNYEAEFAGLPGAYAAPGGLLLLVWQDDQVVGCGAVRPVDATTCEMKRVYLRPGLRGAGYGRQLVESLIDGARAAGYARICLDVLPEFVAAQGLYAALGFVPAPPVSHNPVPGTRFLARSLVEEGA